MKRRYTPASTKSSLRAGPMLLQSRGYLTPLAAVVLFFFGVFCSAQNPEAPQRPPDGGSREYLVSIFIPASQGSPFIAFVDTESVRALVDGARITQKNHRMIARDKEGRIFQERRLLVPEDKKDESIVTQIEITDPVGHQQYICVPSRKVCQVEFFEGRISPAAALPPLTPGQESLGTQVISGMETQGVKEARVIPKGTIGNDTPMISKREFWYSAKLGLNLLSTRDDPRFGSQRFAVVDIVVGDPDPKLFAPPEGFALYDLRKPTHTPAGEPTN